MRKNNLQLILAWQWEDMLFLHGVWRWKLAEMAQVRAQLWQGMSALMCCALSMPSR
jgi:hypothetical protein